MDRSRPLITRVINPIRDVLNETLWMLIISKCCNVCHRRRATTQTQRQPSDADLFKGLSVGMISVAAPAASQPLSGNQSKVKFVSLIVPAVNAEKMGAVGCCKAISFLWDSFQWTSPDHWNSRHSSKSESFTSPLTWDWFSALIEAGFFFSTDVFVDILLISILDWRLQLPIGRCHWSGSVPWVIQTSSSSILAVLKHGLPQLHYNFPSGHLLLEDFISPWYF